MDPMNMPATGPTVTATNYGGCLEVTPVEGGVRLTSNVSPAQGALFLDYAEWADAIAWAKAGRLDVTLESGTAPVTVETPVTAA